MKKTIFSRVGLIAVSLILIVSLAACGGTNTPAASTSTASSSGSADATADLPEMELSLTFHDPETSNLGQALKAWAESVSEKTNGKLTIKLFGSGSLAPGPDALNFVMDGTADIGWLYTMFYPGQFTLTEVVGLPMNGPTHPAQTAEVLWDLYESTPELQAELDGKIKVLQMYGNPVNFISTTSKPIETMADLKGMKLRVPAGGITDVMVEWGASPQLVAAGDAYDALQKKNIAGVSWEWQGIDAFKLYEQLNYFMEGMPIYEGVFLLGMNKEKWDSLPVEYQQIIEETTGRQGSVEFGNVFFTAAELSKETAMAANPNAKVITPTPEAIAEFQAIADAYALKWAENNSKDGFDAAAYMAKAQELTEKYKR